MTMASRSVLLFTCVALGTLAICLDCSARTWFINEEGTGDAPTIPAAMDSAAYGDTVLVGPGTYECYVVMTDGVVLRSETGAAATVLTRNLVWWPIVRFHPGISGSLEGFTLTGAIGDTWDAAAVWCRQSGVFFISANVITGNMTSGIFTTETVGEIVGNTIVDNNGWYGAGVYNDYESYVSVHNNICIGDEWGILVIESSADVECNDCWGNAIDFQGVWNPEASGNFSKDPLFCDRENGDFTLAECSPCLPGNHPNGFECGLIGTFGKGCDCPSTSVEGDPGDKTTWGEIKALFR